MRILTGNTSREVANTVNEIGIKKEDIVSFIYRDNQFIVFYYK